MFIYPHSFGVSCSVLELWAVEMSSSMELDGTLLVVKNLTALSLLRNHDVVTQFHGGTIFFLLKHMVSLRRRKYLSSHGLRRTG